jgi:hypothetical protein
MALNVTDAKDFATMKNLMVMSFLLLLPMPFLTLLPCVAAQRTTALLLFGGHDHKTFLGCLNCVETSDSSVCNEVGRYGSEVAQNSIWNEVGPYGSEVSPTSPWNTISQEAPIIVDPDGNSYGYFSVNAVHHDRTRISWLVAILDYYEETNDLAKTHEKMCGS